MKVECIISDTCVESSAAAEMHASGGGSVRRTPMVCSQLCSCGHPLEVLIAALQLGCQSSHIILQFSIGGGSQAAAQGSCPLGVALSLQLSHFAALLVLLHSSFDGTLRAHTSRLGAAAYWSGWK